MCREAAKYQTFCNDVLNIRIYVKVVAYGMIKLVVNTKGEEEIGTKIYKNIPTEKEEKYWQVIEKRYKEYYELNINKYQTT